LVQKAWLFDTDGTLHSHPSSDGVIGGISFVAPVVYPTLGQDSVEMKRCRNTYINSKV